MPADRIEIDEGQHEGLRHAHLARARASSTATERSAASSSCAACPSSTPSAASARSSTRRVRETIAVRHRDLRDRAAGRLLLPAAGGRDRAHPTAASSRSTRRPCRRRRPDVFAGGDVVLGPRLFIDAIASGQVAARSIHDYLRAHDHASCCAPPGRPRSTRWASTGRSRARQLPPSTAPTAAELPTAGDRLVEENYPEAEARRQAERCLRCDVQTVLRGRAAASPATAASTSAPTTACTSSGSRRSPSDPRLLALAEAPARHRPAEARGLRRRSSSTPSGASCSRTRRPASAARCAPRAARRTRSRCSGSSSTASSRRRPSRTRGCARLGPWPPRASPHWTGRFTRAASAASSSAFLAVFVVLPLFDLLPLRPARRQAPPPRPGDLARRVGAPLARA